MKQQVEIYFQGEQAESMLFVVIGALAIVIAIWVFFSRKKAFYRGMAIPLVIVGIIQASVGATVWNRTPSDIANINVWLIKDHVRARTVEIPRMQAVMRSFVVYRYAEIFLMIAGLAIILMQKEANFLKGFGAGLFAQATILLIADFFAERRGAIYLQQLIDFFGPPLS